VSPLPGSTRRWVLICTRDHGSSVLRYAHRSRCPRHECVSLAGCSLSGSMLSEQLREPPPHGGGEAPTVSLGNPLAGPREVIHVL
jgi:hypothetical protein